MVLSNVSKVGVHVMDFVVGKQKTQWNGIYVGITFHFVFTIFWQLHSSKLQARVMVPDIWLDNISIKLAKCVRWRFTVI